MKDLKGLEDVWRKEDFDVLALLKRESESSLYAWRLRSLHDKCAGCAHLEERGNDYLCTIVECVKPFTAQDTFKEMINLDEEIQRVTLTNSIAHDIYYQFPDRDCAEVLRLMVLELAKENDRLRLSLEQEIAKAPPVVSLANVTTGRVHVKTSRD